MCGQTWYEMSRCNGLPKNWPLTSCMTQACVVHLPRILSGEFEHKARAWTCLKVLQSRCRADARKASVCESTGGVWGSMPIALVIPIPEVFLFFLFFFFFAKNRKGGEASWGAHVFRQLSFRQGTRTLHSVNLLHRQDVVLRGSTDDNCASVMSCPHLYTRAGRAGARDKLHGQPPRVYPRLRTRVEQLSSPGQACTRLHRNEACARPVASCITSPVRAFDSIVSSQARVRVWMGGLPSCGAPRRPRGTCCKAYHLRSQHDHLALVINIPCTTGFVQKFTSVEQPPGNRVTSDWEVLRALVRSSGFLHPYFGCCPFDLGKSAHSF